MVTDKLSLASTVKAHYTISSQVCTFTSLQDDSKPKTSNRGLLHHDHLMHSQLHPSPLRTSSATDAGWRRGMIYLTRTTRFGWRALVLILWMTMPVFHLSLLRLQVQMMIQSRFARLESVGTQGRDNGLPATSAQDGITAFVQDCRTRKPSPHVTYVLLVPRHATNPSYTRPC